MVQLQAKSLTDAWMNATWDQYLEIVENPIYAKAKGYFFDGQMKVETMGVGAEHGLDNGIISSVIFLVCLLRGIPIKGLINASYRQPDVKEVQPDISYYIGDRVSLTPQGSAIIDLDQVACPDLVIEIADSTINDDLGKKRLIYEDLGIAEYWVIDVEKAQVIAFQIVSNGSQRITQSQVLPGLEIALVQEALERRRQMDDTQVGAWLMTHFQK
jgi:Uma2 family endonuclease